METEVRDRMEDRVENHVKSITLAPSLNGTLQEPKGVESSLGLMGLLDIPITCPVHDMQPRPTKRRGHGEKVETCLRYNINKMQCFS